MTNPYSRWQNTGVQNPYAGVSAGISAPSGFSPRRNLASSLPNTTIERPDKFYAGPTERLSAKASPTVSAVQDAAAAVNAATGTTTSNTGGISQPTESDLSTGQNIAAPNLTQPSAENAAIQAKIDKLIANFLPAGTTATAAQRGSIQFLLENPQSFAAGLQYYPKPTATDPTGRYMYEMTKPGIGDNDLAVQIFNAMYGGNPWDITETGALSFPVGYHSYAPWQLDPNTGVPYSEMTRRFIEQTGGASWQVPRQYSWPSGQHFDWEQLQWVSDVPERSPGISPPTLPLTTG